MSRHQVPRTRRGGRSQSLVQHLLLPAIATIIACTGCGGEDWQAETHPAHGRITINGTPPVGAVVELHATGEAVDVRRSRPWAIVQEDGSYILSTYETNDGAPAGDYVLTIRWPPDISQPSMADRLNYAHSNPVGSEWKVTISEGENEIPPLAMVGMKVFSKEQTSAPGAAPPVPGSGK